MASDDEGTSTSQCPEELHRRSEAHVETAEIDVQRSEEAVEQWTSALSEFKTMWHKNGFGEDLVKIFKAPARGRT